MKYAIVDRFGIVVGVTNKTKVGKMTLILVDPETSERISKPKERDEGGWNGYTTTPKRRVKLVGNWVYSWRLGSFEWKTLDQVHRLKNSAEFAPSLDTRSLDEVESLFDDDGE